MDYIEVIEEEPNEIEIDFSSFYADYDYESSDQEKEQCVELADEVADEDYDTMTLKQLLRIRDYYYMSNGDNIPKSKKHTKKNDIIDDILEFETNISNIDIIIRRHQLWNYIEELKADKYMKQFIFWS